MDAKTKFNQVYQKVDALSFSDSSICELFSFAMEACGLAYDLNSKQTNQEFLKHLKHSRDKEIRHLLDNEDNMLRAEKEEKFETAKKNLVQQMKPYLN